MMRKFLIGTFVAVATTATFGTAGAQPMQAYSPNPWCLKASMGKGWVVDLCYYKTFAQCSQDRFNYGSTSFCVQNPEYVFAKAQQEEQRKARRKIIQ